MSDAADDFGSLLLSLGFVSEAQLGEARASELAGRGIGEALLSLGYITRRQLQKVLSIALGGSAVERPHTKLGEVLLELEHIDEGRLASVLEAQREEKKPLGELLVERGDCTYEEVFEALSTQQLRNEAESKRTRVVLIDDSVIVCSFVSQGLEHLGYEVTAFNDPAGALETIEQSPPDVVITDLDMPKLDGAELCRRIKSGVAGHVPVIILTANESNAPVQGLKAGADDYVRKGTSMEELAARIDGMVQRSRATQRMRRLFARYTSDAVVEQVLQTGDVVLTGEKREVTVMFVDIRNFTSFAETFEPEVVMSTLNDILGRLADAVLAHGGTIDKFLGDGLMALFGAPVKRPDDAKLAVHCAREMLAAMAARNREADVKLEVGIGINTGTVVAGSLGNERRTDYTCIGDAVNVAARLCALAGPNEILMGAGTVQQLGEARGIESLEEPLQLKGKTQRVPVFRAV